MRQQINLYQPIFRAERKVFSSTTVAIGLGLVLLGYVAIWGFGNWKVARLAVEVQALEARADSQEAMLNSAAELRARRAKPAALEAQIDKLSTELTRRTRALEVLRSGVAGEPDGFATRLEALARGHLQGVALDRLVLTGAAGDRGNLRLEGAALNADLVPQYLQSLATEDELSGVRFAQFSVGRPDEKSAMKSGVRFSASSAALLETDEQREAAR